MKNKDKVVEDWEQWNNDNVVNELIQGRELARQLQVQLNMPSSSSSYEIQNFLVQNILVSYEKALSLLMLNWTNSPLPKTAPPLSIPIMSETPPSIANPMNKYDHNHNHDHELQNHNWSINSSNTHTRWTKQVRMTPGVGLEETLDDGFDWRKYGQKRIIGSKFLRGYYKCSMRNLEGCLATKQVQILDKDPNIFQVVYRGIHTCSQASSNYKSMNIPINPKEINHERDISTQQMQSFSSFNLASTEENDGLLGCIMNNTNSVYNVGGFSETSAGFVQMNNSQESETASSSATTTTSSTFPFPQTSNLDPPNFTLSNPNAFFF